MRTLGPYTALGHRFDVVVVEGEDAGLPDLLAPLSSTDEPDVTYRLAVPADEEHPGWVEVDGERMPAKDLAGARERLLLAVGRDVQANTAEPLLHACVVELGGKGVLVTGPSGSGKSTLTARLAAAGGGLVAEDLCVLDPSGHVRPYHRPFALAAESLEALGLEVPEEDCRCGCMKHLVSPEALGGAYAGPRKVDLVVFCKARAQGVAALSLAEALAQLFVDGGLGNVDEPDRLAGVAAALSGAACVTLGTADLELALADVLELLEADAARVSVASEPAQDGSVVYLDGEALIRVEGYVHHLDAAATAVWILRTEGLDAPGIAAELGFDLDVVVDTLDRLDALELPALTP